MAAYYNEFDPYAAQWLRELIKAGLIADGEVDTRSITDVQADDLRGFVQCHFFAGIGGWSYALRLAGWDDDRRVWTGSCPCQPFSAAGKGAGADDSRDLWPTWFQLIAQCRPSVVFGEQVASADGLGWFDRVSVDVEAADYAITAVDLCAAGVGAFHIRQRLWFVADTGNAARRPLTEHRTDDQQEIESGSQGASDAGERSAVSNVAESDREQLRAGGSGSTKCAPGAPESEAWQRQRIRPDAGECGAAGALDDSEHQRAGRSTGSEGRPQRAPQGPRQDEGRGLIQTLDTSATRNVGHAEGEGPQGERCQQSAPIINERGRLAGLPGVSWADADWLDCIDGKARPVESGTFPLAYGIPARVGRLRGYGNAIVPQVAAEFIAAYIEARGLIA